MQKRILLILPTIYGGYKTMYFALIKNWKKNRRHGFKKQTNKQTLDHR